jgi:hypothetical protein
MKILTFNLLQQHVLKSSEAEENNSILMINKNL